VKVEGTFLEIAHSSIGVRVYGVAARRRAIAEGAWSPSLVLSAPLKERTDY
jgi:hypothetical protein